MAECSGAVTNHILGSQGVNMTTFEWIIGSLIVGVYAKEHIYYKLFNKKVEEVKKEIVEMRNNDLKHIENRFEQLSDQIFLLAKKD